MDDLQCIRPGQIGIFIEPPVSLLRLLHPRGHVFVLSTLMLSPPLVAFSFHVRLNVGIAVTHDRLPKVVQTEEGVSSV